MFYSETVYVKYKDHRSISLPSAKKKFLIFYIFYLFLGIIIYWHNTLLWIILLIWKYVYDCFSHDDLVAARMCKKKSHFTTES